jgi:hypothetical protein
MVMMGDGANVGERAMLVMELVMGAGVVAEVGEGVGLKVQMGLNVEVAVVVVRRRRRRRRKEKRYLAIKREVLDFLEFGYLQLRSSRVLLGLCVKEEKI